MAKKPVSAITLAYLLEQTARALHALGYASDLFPAQWTALRYFSRAEPHNRTASALARFQGLATGPVTRTVRTLVAKGLVVKSGAAGRGRAERIDLTEAGKSLLAKDPLATVVDGIASLDEDERASFAGSLELVLKRMQDRSARP